MMIELFALGVTAEALRANIDWKSPLLKGMGQSGSKFQVEGDITHQPFFVSCKSLFRFVTIHAFDRQTDRQMLIARPRMHS